MMVETQRRADPSPHILLIIRHDGGFTAAVHLTNEGARALAMELIENAAINDAQETDDHDER